MHVWKCVWECVCVSLHHQLTCLTALQKGRNPQNSTNTVRYLNGVTVKREQEYTQTQIWVIIAVMDIKLRLKVIKINKIIEDPAVGVQNKAQYYTIIIPLYYLISVMYVWLIMEYIWLSA